jgi:hypothetical protein
MMQEVTEALEPAVSVASDVPQVRPIAEAVGAAVVIWGSADGSPQSGTIQVKILDLRHEPIQPPQQITCELAASTDLRFAAERIVEALPDIAPIAHPDEEAVHRDAESDRLWATNPNLVRNGDFGRPENWEAIYRADRYAPPAKDALPEPDQVAVSRVSVDDKMERVLAMNLSKTAAHSKGLACLSDPIKIRPQMRYRLSFRYQSDGPQLHVFVKGYAPLRDINGQIVPREVYRRQVSPSGATGGQWQKVECDLTPRHPAHEVAELRIDLYAYLRPGTVLFDDVVLKAIGPAGQAPALKSPARLTTQRGER